MESHSNNLEQELDIFDKYYFKNGEIYDETNKIIINTVNQDSCVICLDDYNNNDTLILLKCNHYFHEICGKDWLRVKRECPICREKIELECDKHEEIIIDVNDISINNYEF
jgi:hypothetical protein